MSDLTERRAFFVYEGARIAAMAAGALIVPAPWHEREEAFTKQFRDVIERQCGPDRSESPEELHGSWVQAYVTMGWTYGEKYDARAKTHPDLVPYAKLSQLERDKDAVFVALCEIARQWVYDETVESWTVGGETVFKDQAMAQRTERADVMEAIPPDSGHG